MARIADIFPETKLIFKNSFVGHFLKSATQQKFLDYLLHLISNFQSRKNVDNNNGICCTENDHYSLLGFFFEHHNEKKLIEKAEGQIDMKKVKVEKSISYEVWVLIVCSLLVKHTEVYVIHYKHLLRQQK